MAQKTEQKEVELLEEIAAGDSQDRAELRLARPAVWRCRCRHGLTPPECAAYKVTPLSDCELNTELSCRASTFAAALGL